MIETTWDKDRGIIFRHLQGDVSFEEMVDCIKQGPENPEFEAFPSTVWVFGKVNFTGKPERMSIQMPLLRRLTDETGDGRRIAWVTKSAVAQKMLKGMFNGDRWSSTWQVFDTTDEAIEWCTPGD